MRGPSDGETNGKSDYNPLHDKIDDAIVKAWAVEDLTENLKTEISWPYYGWHIYKLALEATDRSLDGLDLDAVMTVKEVEEFLATQQKPNGSIDKTKFTTISTCLAILTFRKSKD